MLSNMGNVLALTIGFAILGILLYLRIHIGIALSITALIIGFVSLGPASLPNIVINTIYNKTTTRLMFITALILILILMYKETGYINELGESLRRILKKSILSLIVIPAVMGLLPVTGGALISAPLVDIEGKKLGLSNPKKVFINIWFRHLIFLTYPLSQLIILTAALTGMSIWSIILRQIPIMVFMLIIGYLISFIKREDSKNDVDYGSKNNEVYIENRLYISLIRTLLPIAIPILMSILVKLDLTLSILIGIALLIFFSKPHYMVFKRILGCNELYLVTLAAFGAMLLRNTIIYSGIQDFITSIMSGTYIHPILLMILLPVVLAILTGMTQSSLAISIPILQTITDFTVREVSLVYISAFLGYLGAPTHLCLILTLNYFKSSLFAVYKYLIPANVVTLMFTVLLYFIW